MRDMEKENTITRESVLKLMESKDEIEAQLKQLKEVLDRNNIGLKESVVDREGYPRQDVDVYEVVQARHKIICLQNDHKAIMSKIEKGLHFLHSQSAGNLPVTQPETDLPEIETRPFAKIVHVEHDSPAEKAGLMDGDLIVSFGSVNSNNFKTMQDIGSLVQHSVGRNILISLQRSTHLKRLSLTPKEWKGKGLLGCVIVGLENVER